MTADENVLGPVSFSVSRAQLRRYADSSGDHNPLHRDPVAAAAAGLPDVVAHGMLTMGLAMRAITERTTGAWTVQRSHARFLRPVPVGADSPTVLIVQGVVKPHAEEPGTTKAEVTVRCSGAPVAAVTAVLRQRRSE